MFPLGQSSSLGGAVGMVVVGIYVVRAAMGPFMELSSGCSGCGGVIATVYRHGSQL